MSDFPASELDERLTRVERELKELKDGLRLLGMKSCSWCIRFFRSDGGSNLFDGGELVCGDCIQEWWEFRRKHLVVKERELIERRLTIWLVKHRNAKVVHSLDGVNQSQLKLRIVAGCAECDGAGTIIGKRCGFCHGRGAVWIIERYEDSGESAA